MHELAIAEALVAIVTEHAGGRRVARVDVQVGHLRQVVPDALAFAFEIASVGTVAEGADLVLEEIPAQGTCRSCGARGRLTAFPFACAACGSWHYDITDGEQLCVTSLEVYEEAGAR